MEMKVLVYYFRKYHQSYLCQNIQIKLIRIQILEN